MSINKLTDLKKQLKTIESEITDLEHNKLTDLKKQLQTIISEMTNKLTDLKKQLETIVSEIADLERFFKKKERKPKSLQMLLSRCSNLRFNRKFLSKIKRKIQQFS
jgi:TolA-binding protein